MGVPASDAHAMIELLDASGPNEEHAERLMLFGQFVGSWDIEVTYFDREGAVTDERRAEWHCGWVLEGRAIQDVWISPPLEEQRRTGTPGLEYGMQFRMYEPRTDTWRVTWFDLISATMIEVVARAVGEEIVLEGAGPDGTLHRWILSDITPDANTFTGHESKDDGRTWLKVERFILSRRGSR